MRRRSSDEELVCRVLEFFPELGRLKRVEAGGGTAGRNVVFSTEKGRFFLRGRNPKYCTQEEIVYDHSLMRHLSERGVPVPLPIVSSEGKTWLRIDEFIYELYEFIEGRPFEPKSVLDLQRVSRALATYHLATEGFTPEGSKPRAEKREGHPSKIMPILEEMQRKAKGAAYRTVSYLISQLLAVQERLPDEEYSRLRHLIIHGDFHPANIIFGYDGRVYFTDFDWASMQARAIDISDGIIFFAGRRESEVDGSNIVSLTQTFEMDLERTKIFLEAYQEEGELSEDEIEAIPWLLRNRWIQCRAKGSLKVPEDERLNYLVDKVEGPLHWLDRFEGQLVAELKRIIKG